jgi:hypothetical protein
MAIKQLNPYLNFNGDAVKAIALYERVFQTKATDALGISWMFNGPKA